MIVKHWCILSDLHFKIKTCDKAMLAAEHRMGMEQAKRVTKALACNINRASYNLKKVNIGTGHMQTHTIYTIGHSNQDVEGFIELLKKNSIEVVVDVRSSPYSKYASQFNKSGIQKVIQDSGIKYLFMGQEIGGKPVDMQFYDSKGYVLYSKIAESPEFIEGIQRLLKGIKQYRVALMCSEENPETCHRRLLIGRVLSDHGVNVLHIRSDSSILAEEDFSSTQQSLFSKNNRADWKSTRPVLK